MGYIYILTGKVFGKDIYEIDYTNDLKNRLLSDKTGYPKFNSYLHIFTIHPNDINYCKQLLHKSLLDYSINNNFYKIILNNAIDIIQNNLNTYIKQYETLEKPQSHFCGLIS